MLSAHVWGVVSSLRLLVSLVSGLDTIFIYLFIYFFFVEKLYCHNITNNTYATKFKVTTITIQELRLQCLIHNTNRLA